MKLDDLTIGEAKELARLFGSAEKTKEAHYRVGQYCIIRCKEAGVHAGVVADYDPETGDARVSQCRRLWRWDSQFTLSELAEIGVRKQENCRFSVPVEDATICGVCELLQCKPSARKSIEEVPNANEN